MGKRANAQKTSPDDVHKSCSWTVVSQKDHKFQLTWIKKQQTKSVLVRDSGPSLGAPPRQCGILQNWNKQWRLVPRLVRQVQTLSFFFLFLFQFSFLTLFLLQTSHFSTQLFQFSRDTSNGLRTDSEYPGLDPNKPFYKVTQ